MRGVNACNDSYTTNKTSNLLQTRKFANTNQKFTKTLLILLSNDFHSCLQYLWLKNTIKSQQRFDSA